MVKRKTRFTVLLIALLCCVLFFGYYTVTRSRKDTAAPVIKIPGETLSVTVDADDAALLRGVTAEDNRDGDVTESLLVERVSMIPGQDNSAEVTFAAFDSSGNVTRARRTVEFTDYVGPRFTLSGSLRFSERSKIDVFSLIGATDAIDGDLSDRVKGTLQEGGSSISQPGDYLVEFRVTNNLSDTAYLTLPVEVYEGSTDVFEIVLSDYLIYLKTGDSLEPMEFVDHILAGGQEYEADSLPSGFKLSVDSDLNTEKPGVYQITYLVEMNQYRGCSRLVAVVEE